MKIYGYSERGILNSLFYEIMNSEESDVLLGQLITCCRFPLTNDKPTMGTATVLVEQSLSQFGDADAIIFTKPKTKKSLDDQKKCTIFVEAKVKTSQSREWLLEDQFEKFKEGLKTRVNSSNIFTQFYHKQILVAAIKSNGIEKRPLRANFPSWSSRRIRSTGRNPVVHKAIVKIKEHINNVFYLALLPDTEDNIKDLFKNRLNNDSFSTVPGWDVSHHGYLTWSAVKAFCEEHELKATLKVFEYNGDQIF
jgi:hypothetical protein